MDLILCWLIAPAGLLLVTVGLSLLLERLTGFALPWTVRPALGLAVAIVIAQFGTATDATAELTLPATLLLALLGLALGADASGAGRGAPSWIVPVAVFLLFASPFLILGEATLAGYIKLDDTATWLAITDHVFEFGRGVGGLAPSTHQQVLADYLGGSYPIGGFVPMALMSEISGQDLAFTIQPSMAFAAGTMALLLFELARRLVRGAGRRRWDRDRLLARLAAGRLLPLGRGQGDGRRGAPAAGPAAGGLRRERGLAAPRLAAAGRGRWRRWSSCSGPAARSGSCRRCFRRRSSLWRRDGARRVLRLAWPLAVFSLLLVLPVIFGPTGIFDPLNEGVTGSGAEAWATWSGRSTSSRSQASGRPIDFRFDPHLKPATIALAAVCLAHRGRSPPRSPPGSANATASP